MYKWGIIGLGKIAHKFAQDIALTEGAILHAVASRSADKAKAFAAQYGAPKYYGSYEALVKAKEVDVIYIATPHVLHSANTLMCLKADLPVLCEKPFAMNSSEVLEMVELARTKGVFLMEALWTRFSPSMLKVLTWIADDAIGDVQMIRADFGFKATYDTESRLFNPKLGGGALLDIGIYPVFLSLLLFGMPQTIQASAKLGATGVDEYCAMVLDYEGDKKALLHASLVHHSPTEAFIWGSKGTIHMKSKWHRPCSVVLECYDGKTEHFDSKEQGNGYIYELEEVQRCLNEGKLESPLLNLDFSINLMTLLDTIREKIGLTYTN